jgi:hypothetical protein
VTLLPLHILHPPLICNNPGNWLAIGSAAVVAVLLQDAISVRSAHHRNRLQISFSVLMGCQSLCILCGFHMICHNRFSSDSIAENLDERTKREGCCKATI